MSPRCLTTEDLSVVSVVSCRPLQVRPRTWCSVVPGVSVHFAPAGSRQSVFTQTTSPVNKKYWSAHRADGGVR